jgi:hypothetical protein
MMADGCYSSALDTAASAMQMSLAALGVKDGGGSNVLLNVPSVDAPMRTKAAANYEADIAELRQQLRQKETRNKKLLQGQARLREALGNEAARADAAESLNAAAKGTLRRGEMSSSKHAKLEKRAALAKQMRLERDAALRLHAEAQSAWEVQLQARDTELRSAHERAAELDAELSLARTALARKESEHLGAVGQLKVVQKLRRGELDTIKAQAQAQWSDFHDKQTGLLRDQLQESITARITAPAESKIREIAQQLLASKRECQRANEELGRVQAKHQQTVAELSTKEAASQAMVEQAREQATEMAWVHVETARAEALSEREGREAVETRYLAAVAARAEAEEGARVSARSLARMEARARHAEVTLRSLTGDVEARASAELRALREAEARITAERKADEVVEVLATTKGAVGALEAQIKEFAAGAAAIDDGMTDRSDKLGKGQDADWLGGATQQSIAADDGGGLDHTVAEQKADEIAAALVRTEGVLELMRTQVKLARDKMQRMRMSSAAAGEQGAADSQVLAALEQRLQEAQQAARQEEEAKLRAEQQVAELRAQLAKVESELRLLRGGGGGGGGDGEEGAPAGHSAVIVGDGRGSAGWPEPTLSSAGQQQHKVADHAVLELAQEAHRMLAAHGDATRAIAAAAHADMVQTVECSVTEADAKVHAVADHAHTFNAEQLQIIDFFDAELVKLERQVETAERARQEADERARELALTLEATTTNTSR